MAYEQFEGDMFEYDFDNASVQHLPVSDDPEDTLEHLVVPRRANGTIDAEIEVPDLAVTAIRIADCTSKCINAVNAGQEATRLVFWQTCGNKLNELNS